MDSRAKKVAALSALATAPSTQPRSLVNRSEPRGRNAAYAGADDRIVQGLHWSALLT
jgi:hypothetical protein